MDTSITDPPQFAPSPSCRQLLPATCLWLIALILSSFLDRPLAQWAHDSGVAAALDRHWIAYQVIKRPGTFWFTAIVALGVGFLHPHRWSAALFMLLTASIGLLNTLVKWCVGRPRPFKVPQNNSLSPYEFYPFFNGWHGLLQQHNLAFPSGHACMAFATATGLAILLPRWRWAFYSCAGIVAAERVLENAHYLSDTLGAAALAWIGVHCLAWLLPRPSRDRSRTIAELSREFDVPISLSLSGHSCLQRAREHPPTARAG